MRFTLTLFFFYLQISLLVLRKSPLRTWLARDKNGARIVPGIMIIDLNVTTKAKTSNLVDLYC